MAVRPFLVNGDIHLVYVTGTGDIFYAEWDWSSASGDAVKLYENIELPVAGTFLGTKKRIDQGITI